MAGGHRYFTSTRGGGSSRIHDGDMTRTVAEPGDKPHKGDADNEDPMTRKDKLR